MAQKGVHVVRDFDTLFEAILALQTKEECQAFFEDLCTMRELEDMAQRVEAARLLLDGKTYDQIVRLAAIRTATISRINRCIRYGGGGYETVLRRIQPPKESGDASEAQEQADG